MFGYIRPVKEELRVLEFELYRSVYCSICKISGKKFGVFSRAFIGYDGVFIALVAMSLKSSEINIKKGSCVFCKVKKCLFCSGFEKEFEFAAACCVILGFFKILDDIKDSKNMFRKSFYFLKLLLFKRCYRKVSKVYSNLKDTIKKQIKNQERTENTKKPSFDTVSYATSEIMSTILSFLSENENEKRVLKNIGLFVGKWVYIVDAVHDVDVDLKEKNFNLFILKFGKNKNKIKESARYILNQILYQILLSYNLLKVENLRDILDNIFKLGFKEVQSQVLDGNFNKTKKEFIYRPLESEILNERSV